MPSPAPVPALRLGDRNRAPVRPERAYVLYWMIAARRTHFSFALDRAIEWALELGRPLVVLEALRAGYRWASDRHHRFVLDGMAEKAAALAASPVLYYPYVEAEPGAGQGLLAALARRAAVVVTDEYPSFFLPRMVAAAAERVGDVRLEAVDGNGLLPLRATERVFTTAFSFRRFLHGAILPHLAAAPSPDPIAAARGLRAASPAAVPATIRRRWPAATRAALARSERLIAALPIDHRVAPAPFRGGEAAARERLRRFLGRGLAGYATGRSHPDRDHESGLSPYLHFGHIGAHEVFAALAAREAWSAERVARRPTGKRAGFWGMGADAEAFLDQLLTWRELGFNLCAKRADHDGYGSLPPWARRTLAEHAADVRPVVYARDDLERGRTHDRLWNAAANQLRREGRLQNYLRMLWGKKILEWSASPEEALATMIELNHRHAVDGRDPNSTSGIFWTLGRYDRPWGPERPIFGTVRYLSSENTARKLELKRYLARHGGEDGPRPGEEPE